MAEMKKKVVSRKRKEIKKIDKGQVHIQSSFNNTIVTVTDMKTQEQLQKTIDSINADKDLDKTKLEYVLGQHRIEDFENADCVIKNPGVKIQGNKCDYGH